MRADDVMAMIDAHFRGEREKFRSVALMVAANDAKLWGGDFAARVRRLVDGADAGGLTKLPRGENGQDTVAVRPAYHRLADLVLSPDVSDALGQLLAEHRHADALRERGCEPAYKVLFNGPPGTGKTSAAGAVADALGVPFVVAKQHEIVDSHLGASDKAVARLFDFASANRAVVLLDEFDAVGSSRGGGEASSATKAFNMIVTTLLQMFDRHNGPAVVVAATNLPGELDAAVRRRFDLSVAFGMPSEADRRELIRRTIGDADGPFHGSHAEVVRDCLREKKRRVLAELEGTTCGGS